MSAAIFDPKDLSDETHQARITAMNAVKEFFEGPAFIVNNCHITVEAFLRFMKRERNVENLTCALELKAIKNFIKNEKSKQDIDDEDSFGDDTSSLSSEVSNSQSFAQKIFKELKHLIAKTPEEKALLLTERMAVMLFTRCEAFHKTYISVDSCSEVNLDNKTRVAVDSLFKRASDLYLEYQGKRKTSLVEERNSMLQQLFSLLEEFMAKLENKLLANLTDPFKRFLKSIEFKESIAVFFAQSDNSSLRFKLLGPFQEGVCLNTFKKDDLDRSPIAVAEYLINCWAVMGKQHDLWVESSSNKGVDFNHELITGGNISTRLEHYKKAVGDLQSVKLETLQTEEEKISFFVNVHNALMLHTVIVIQNVPSVPEIWAKVQAKAQYKIGGQDYSLADIRKILKVDPPSKNKLSALILDSNNQRYELAFLLCSGTRNCAALQKIQAKNLNSQLELAVKELVEKQAVQLHKNEDNTVVITVPDNLAKYASILQKGIKAKNSNFANTLLKAFDEEKMALLNSAKKVYVAHDPFKANSTDFSCVVNANVAIDESVSSLMVLHK